MKLLPLALSFFLLAGCTQIKVGLLRVLQDNTPYVFQDEYVLWADGYWCEWGPTPAGVVLASHGSCGAKPAHPPGVYLVDGKGNLKRRTSSDSVEYDKLREMNAARECERYTSQGIACAPNFLVDKLATNDPLFGELWGLSGEGLNIAPLWAEGASAPNIKVSIIDTGVTCGHEDIGACLLQFDSTTGREIQVDENGHGTHCAGSACGIGGNGKGISGVSQRCQILAAKFMGSNGSGSLYSAASAIKWSVDNGAHIISASWGAPYGTTVLRKAVEYADSHGVLFVTAAGNDAKDIDQTPQYPASYDLPNVITVGAHDDSGGKSWFSNWGLQTVEVFAPGASILSTWNNGGYRELDGTSMATPHVSGLAALLWERELGQGSKREQMLRVIEKLSSLGSGALREFSRFGALRVPGEAPEPNCREKKCKKCLKECNTAHECQCKRWRKCRRGCRDDNNCGVGCR